MPEPADNLRRQWIFLGYLQGYGIMAVALEAFCLMMFRWFVAVL